MTGSLEVGHPRLSVVERWVHYGFMETLNYVRFRLAQLVEGRISEPFTSSEHVEYEVLTKLEKTLLDV